MFGNKHDIKKIILVIGDLAAAYLALFATLYLRYGANDFRGEWLRHFQPFSLSFLLWLVVFFIVGLYELDRVRSRLNLLSRLGEALAASFLISLAIFYLSTDYHITPKTNLAIAMAIFGMLVVGWRLLAIKLFARTEFRNTLLFLGDAPEASELCEVLNVNPLLGWTCLGVFAELPSADLPQSDTIIVSHLLGGRETLTRALYGRFFAATTITDFPSFYESIRRSVPASALSEQWVLSNLATRDIAAYDHVKRPLDAALAAILLIPALPIMALVALAVRLGGPGPIFYTQERVGRGGKTFRIIKFRTMRPDAEKEGAVFASKGDPRVTPIGKFLRATRLDELPQLWNILRGEMSFVGPRPERPEFERKLAETMPVFPVRHIIRPGLTGWAQVNDRYAASDEDHLRKLRHDLYYLKHRSLMLDLSVILKTFYSVLKRQGQ